MKKINQTRKKGTQAVGLLLIIGISVYIGFTPLFELVNGGVAGAVIGASFGAIFVIILTMYLLNKQTEIEQESKKSEKVFDEKVQLFKEIMTITRDSLIRELVAQRMKQVDGEKYTETLHQLYKDYEDKDLESIVARYNLEFSRAVTVDEVSTLLP